jgi:hypothetical protein
MIEAIDDQDKWWNTLPSWVGWGNGVLSSSVAFNTEKTEALKVMSPDMEKWGDITLERLKKYFIEGKTGTDNDKTLSELISGSDYYTMKTYIE